MSKAKKTPVRFEFDQSDEAQRTLSAEYPKSRMQINILRSVLVGLLLLTLLLAAFLPIAQQRRVKTEHTVSFSAADTVFGFIGLAIQTGEFEEQFEKSGAISLLESEAELNERTEEAHIGHHGRATDEQIKEDVAFKREATKGFNGFIRFASTVAYYNAIKLIREDVLTPTESLKKTWVSQDTLRFVQEELQEVSSKAPLIAELLPYEIEHLNYGGAVCFLRGFLAAMVDDAVDAETYETLKNDFLLGEYDLQELTKNVAEKQADLIGIINSPYLPDFHDTYALNEEGKAEFVVGAGDENVPTILIMSILIMLGVIIMLIITIVSGVQLFKMWKNPYTGVKLSLKSFLHLYLTVMAFVLALATGTYMEAVMSPAVIIFAIIAIGTFIYEIVVDVRIKKFREKFLKEA